LETGLLVVNSNKVLSFLETFTDHNSHPAFVKFKSGPGLANTILFEYHVMALSLTA
jgi:hypothetical protein